MVMEKKKNRSCSDELALVKAAAWAWYQHGSGSDGKPMREFDITTATRASYRPSRYKLEAVRNNTANTTMDGLQPPHNSLLDSYEIESISKRLDQYIDLSGIKFYDDLFVIDDYQKNLVLDGDHWRKKRSTKLTWFLPRRAVVCGRNRDVDERAFRDKADRRRSEKHGPVIKMVNCKPRAAHA